MNFTVKLLICALGATSITGCVSTLNEEQTAVKQLVQNSGKLKQNVDPDFLGEAYDQNGDKVICKKVGVTGSRIQQFTVCRTEAEWENTADSAADKMKRIQDSSVAFSDKG